MRAPLRGVWGRLGWKSHMWQKGRERVFTRLERMTDKGVSEWGGSVRGLKTAEKTEEIAELGLWEPGSARGASSPFGGCLFALGVWGVGWSAALSCKGRLHCSSCRAWISQRECLPFQKPRRPWCTKEVQSLWRVALRLGTGNERGGRKEKASRLGVRLQEMEAVVLPAN